jgi:hypothetical protein
MQPHRWGARIFLRGDFFPTMIAKNMMCPLVGGAQKRVILEGNGVSKKTFYARFADVGGFFENRARKTG